MQTITIKQTIPAPIEQVFDIITDHANYKQLPGISDSRLVKLGSPGKNGTGAVRWIKAGMATFTEEITRYERPTRMDYQITKSFPPVRHKCGSMRLEKTPDGTLVTWTTTVELRLPLIGRLLTPLLAAQLSKGFTELLQGVALRLAG
jgi:uncharacterized protein YndB with AHSA1/START domain